MCGFHQALNFENPTPNILTSDYKAFAMVKCDAVWAFNFVYSLHFAYFLAFFASCPLPEAIAALYGTLRKLVFAIVTENVDRKNMAHSIVAVVRK